MNGDVSGTTTVEVELRGRKATIEDVQQALDQLSAEGIPGTFEIDVYQRTQKVAEAGVEYRDQKEEHVLTVRASRVAKSVSS